MLSQLLYENASAHPDDTAIVYRDERITHADLLDRVARLANGLAERGIGPGDAVGVLLPNDPSFIISLHAITGLGGVVAPVNPAFKQDELDFSFRTSEVQAVITDDRGAPLCERIVGGWERPAEVITAGAGDGRPVTLEGLIEQHSPMALDPRPPDDPFVYLFSSGSTGRPKRVPRTNAQIWAEAHFYGTMGLEASDRIFCAVPFFHAYGMGLCALAEARTGATLVILEDPNPFMLRRERALELLQAERATWFPGVPFNFRLLAEAPVEADLSSLRVCFSAGTALPPSTFDAFREKYGIGVRQLYGCSEAGTLTANMDPDPLPASGSVGHPVAEVKVKVVDDDGDPLPPGAVGEVAVSSPALTSGYSGMDELNRQVFRDGYFLSGDLGRLDDEGRLTIAGRKKLLIEVGGYKVDPVEVEDVVLAHPAVQEAVVVGAGGQAEGEQVVKAVVVPAGDCEERELVRFCQERLANYKVPRTVEFRDEIPKSPLGKILRKYLV